MNICKFPSSLPLILMMTGASLSSAQHPGGGGGDARSGWRLMGNKEAINQVPANVMPVLDGSPGFDDQNLAQLVKNPIVNMIIGRIRALQKQLEEKEKEIQELKEQASISDNEKKIARILLTSMNLNRKHYREKKEAKASWIST